MASGPKRFRHHGEVARPKGKPRPKRGDVLQSRDPGAQTVGYIDFETGEYVPAADIEEIDPGEPLENPRSGYDALAADIAKEAFETVKDEGLFDTRVKSSDLDRLWRLGSFSGNIPGTNQKRKILINVIALRSEGDSFVLVSGSYGRSRIKGEPDILNIVYERPPRLGGRPDLERIYYRTVEVARHELQHGLQRESEESASLGRALARRGLKEPTTKFKWYFARKDEIDAYAAGLYASAKKSRRSFYEELEYFRWTIMDLFPTVEKRYINDFIIKVHERAIELYPEILKHKRVPKKRQKRQQKDRARAAMARRNPRRKKSAKKFADKPHDWKEVLISRPGKSLTRKQIRDYYVRNQDKIWPFLKGQTVAIIFAPKRNSFVRRRKGPDGEYIKLTKLKGIDDPRSYEYWINRRVIEFHPVLTTKTTPILWLDLDMHKTRRKETRKKLLAKMRRSVPKLKKAFEQMGVTDVHVYTSGTQGGIHLSGNLPGRRSVDTTRKKFRAVLDEAFADDPGFTTGPAKSGQIRLDTTTFHTLGSLRAPYSMTVHGDAKKPIGRRS